MLSRVISGGQTGVDIAALRAAKACGIPTGGYMPKGFRTEIGDMPGFAEKFGMKETESRDYPLRTRKNIQAADVTLIITENPNSPGTKLTKRLCEEMGAPYLMLTIEGPLLLGATIEKHTEKAVAFLRHPFEQDRPYTLNVAGNRNMALQSRVEAWLKSVFTAVLGAQTKGATDS